MPSFFDLQKFAATGIASHEMTYFDKMRALSMAGGGTIKTLTGIPPLSFTGNGKPLISLSMLGNAQQTGTPTPDAPIQPTFCGVRTRNLFDSSQPVAISNKYLLSDGTESSAASGWVVSAYIPVNGEYVTLSGVGGNAPSICAYDANKQFVRGKNYGGANKTTISISGCSYVRFSYVPSVQGAEAMLNSGSTALPYEPYGYKIPITCAGQTVPVYLGQTQTVRRIKKLVLSGTENWRESSDGNIYIALSPNRAVAWTRVLSTHFTSSQVQTNGGLLWLVNADVDFDTVEECKTYLAQQYAAGTPVTVWYVLAEPETGIVNEPLAKIGDYADELHSTDAAATIPTTKGDNTLTVDTELQPSSMTITGNIKPL